MKYRIINKLSTKWDGVADYNTIDYKLQKKVLWFWWTIYTDSESRVREYYNELTKEINL